MLTKAAVEIQGVGVQIKLNEGQISKLVLDTKIAVYQMGKAAAEAIQVEQQTAMSQAAMTLAIPMISGLLSKYNINVDLNAITPMLGILNPQARTNDLIGAMPPAAAPPPAPTTIPASMPAQQPPRVTPPARVAPPTPVECHLPNGDTKKMLPTICHNNAGSIMQ